MRIFAIVLFSVLCVSGSVATTWHVDQGGGGDFTSIQPAIDAAAPGDQIIVHAGSYTENLDYSGKDLWIQSQSGPNSTTVDGGYIASCVTFRSGETTAAILEGFTLTRGAGTLFETNIVGGAIFCIESSPTVRECRFIDNVADYAAGIYVNYGADMEIIDCHFQDNTAATYGGAIAGPRSTPNIRRSVFIGNYAGTGDGTIHLALSSVIEDCIFRGNSARAGGAINSGGYGADFQIRNYIFVGNSAHGLHGGAIRVHEARPMIEDCLFVGNWAVLDGGAMIVIDGADPDIRSCTFDRNSADRNGGAFAVWSGSYPVISHCIIARSVQSEGVHCVSSYPAFYCCDTWGNEAGNYTGSCSDPTGTNGNISLDPRICNPDSEDYAIAEDSPCAPDYNPQCGLIGAYDVGCEHPTALEQTTWGRLKSVYR